MHKLWAAIALLRALPLAEILIKLLCESYEVHDVS
jgi:hypothetical protein